MSTNQRETTRFVSPPERVLDELVSVALNNAGERAHPRLGMWVESGSSSLVFLLGETALRVTRQPHSAMDAKRAQALVDALPALPFSVPRSRGACAEMDGYVAIPVARLSGQTHPPGEGEPRELRNLLGSIHAIDPETVTPFLAEPRSFMGGSRWESVLRDQVVPLLAATARPDAERRIDALALLEPQSVVVNHGDLAGSNVLWSEGQVSGVLDWDLAALDDPAEDVASLAAWHGWRFLTQIAGAEVAARAEVFRRTFPLQVVAFALLNARPPEEVERAVSRAERRIRE